MIRELVLSVALVKGGQTLVNLAKARFASVVTVAPTDRLTLSWTGEQADAIYRIHGSNTLVNPVSWPVLLITNNTTAIITVTKAPNWFFYVTACNGAMTNVPIEVPWHTRKGWVRP